MRCWTGVASAECCWLVANGTIEPFADFRTDCTAVVPFTPAGTEDLVFATYVVGPDGVLDRLSFYAEDESVELADDAILIGDPHLEIDDGVGEMFLDSLVELAMPRLTLALAGVYSNNATFADQVTRPCALRRPSSIDRTLR
jgi:hypothetical protein